MGNTSSIDRFDWYNRKCNKVNKNIVLKGEIVMKCPDCLIKMVESNLNHNTDEIFIQRYFCFDCGTLYECTSQSGDMVEEYLDVIGEI